MKMPEIMKYKIYLSNYSNSDINFKLSSDKTMTTQENIKSLMESNMEDYLRSKDEFGMDVNTEVSGAVYSGKVGVKVNTNNERESKK